MKRSRALELIASAIPIDSRIDAYELEKLLSFIEHRVGMAPPLALVNDSPYIEGSKWWGSNKSHAHKWEPEDEQ